MVTAEPQSVEPTIIESTELSKERNREAADRTLMAWMTELASLGVKPEDVDTVFFTHLHPDHVGWNLQESGGRTSSQLASWLILLSG